MLFKVSYLNLPFFLCRKLSFSFIDVAGSIVGVDVCGWWVGVGADVAGGGEHSGSVDAGAGDYLIIHLS